LFVSSIIILKIDLLAEPEIGDLHVAQVVHKTVARGQIAMNELTVGEIDETSANLKKEKMRLGGKKKGHRGNDAILRKGWRRRRRLL